MLNINENLKKNPFPQQSSFFLKVYMNIRYLKYFYHFYNLKVIILWINV